MVIFFSHMNKSINDINVKLKAKATFFFEVLREREKKSEQTENIM